MLKGKGKQLLLILILVFTVLLVWDNSSLRDQVSRDNSYLIPQLNLSALPEDISESLSLLAERAEAKQNSIRKESRFKLDITAFSTPRIITSSTPLIIQTYYRGSKQLVQRVVGMPESFVGLSTVELKDLAKEWQIKDDNFDQALLLYREIDDSPKGDEQLMHLGIKDGKVAIFHGSSGSNLHELTDIIVGNLPPAERGLLQKGIQVNSQEELISILEGLVSYNED